MARRQRKKRLTCASRQVLGKWTLESRVGSGGNGEVWVAHSGGTTAAIKVLVVHGQTALARFQAEILAMKESADVRGILPVLDDFINSPGPALHEARAWFAMPLATPAPHALVEASVAEIVHAVHSWAVTLAHLHRRGISHRDIKPENLFKFNDEWVVGDFGLVRTPSMPRVTRVRETIGPWTIMPPEMRRDAISADGSAADVYLLAKTLWMLLAQEKWGFDGQFVVGDPVLGLEERRGAAAFVQPLAYLIAEATKNSPHERPTMLQFAEVLQRWQVAHSDFHERASEEWRQTVLTVASTHPPRQATWHDPHDIAAVLKTVSKYQNTNHLFYPSGGGDDLERVAVSAEPDCLELRTGSTSIVRPTRLVLELFHHTPEWNYFWLETDGLEPALDEPDEDDDLDSEGPTSVRSREEVTELYPGQYVEYSAWERGWFGYDEGGSPRDLPRTARRVVRYFTGTFVIFGKRSPYNLMEGTYDARHAKMTAPGFREYVEGLISRLKQKRVATGTNPVALPRFRPPAKGAPNRFATVAEHVLQLARSRRLEELERRPSEDTDRLDVDNLFQRGPHEQSLRDYLESLDADDVRKLEVLMYSGRDGDSFPDTHRILRYASTDVARQTILGKLPLDTYLQDGLQLLRGLRFDLDAPLSKLG